MTMRCSTLSSAAGTHRACAGRTRQLPERWRVRRGPVRRIDDAQLRTENGEKIDWGGLTSAEREATLGELDSTRLVIRE